MPERVQGQQGRLVAVVAMVAVLVVSGCGSQSAEPQDKDWDEGGSKSQQQSDGKDDKSDDQSDSGQKGKDGDEKIEVEAGEETDEGNTDGQTVSEVKAFLTDYLDKLNAATRDGDFSRTEPMIEDCTSCDGSRETIEPVYKDGGKVKGGLFVEPKVDVGRTAPNGAVTVTVVSTISAYEVVDASGTVVDDGPEETQTYQYSVAKKGGNWKIVSGRYMK